MALGKASKKAVKKEQERLEKEQEQRDGNQSDIKWLNLKQGENLVRFLPPWSDEVMEFWFESGIHYGLPNPNDPTKNTAYGCLADYDEECPICEEVKRLFTSKDEGNVEKAKRMNRKRRIYYNVLNIDDPDKGVQVLGVGPTIHEEVISYFNEYGDITDLEAGYNLKIIKKVDGKLGKQFGTSYKVRIERDPSRISKSLIPEIEEDIQDLTVVLPKPNEDDMLASLGRKKKKKSTEDDDEKPRGKKKRATEDDDEEEDERDTRRKLRGSKKKRKVEEEDDEDEKPKRRKKKRAVEEDDEDEKPKKKKKSKKKSSDEDDDLEKELKDMEDEDEDWDDWDEDED